MDGDFSSANPFKKIIDWYFSKQSLPYWCMAILDCVIVFFSGLMTYWVINRSLVLLNNRFEVIYTLLLYVFLSAISAKVFKTYLAVIRYSSFDDLLKVACANGVTLIFALATRNVAETRGVDSFCSLTNSVTVLTFILATMGMWLVRVLVKALYEVSFKSSKMYSIFIYGTLSGVAGLSKNIRSQRPRRFRICGYLSPEQTKNVMLMGKRVYGRDENIKEILKKHAIEAILVSPVSANDFRNDQDLQDILIGAGCKIFMLEEAKEARIEDGKISEEGEMQLKEVQVEDLLPRSEIRVDLKSVGEMLKDRRVLITGAAGSIGSEIVRQVAQFAPEAMMLIDQAETPEHDVRLMMSRNFPDVKAETVVTSICKEDRMEEIFSRFRPDYVFHAAAYKHVPMMEDNPSEAVQNNIMGTKIVADLSVKYGVKKFVMVSTDKAVNPTNVMGCSKRICEIYVQSLNRKLELESMKAVKGTEKPHFTQFVTTRFGNVLGSNGSVIPLFKEQIRKGGPVTVTDERIVRFFMLIPEACKLVLEAGTKGNGGEIFVFDMGQPVKISELAKRMIALSGAKNIEIKYTGLLEGEKLYEEVLNELENTKPTFHEKIRIAEVREYDYTEVCDSIQQLYDLSKHYDDMATVRKMKEIVPEYKSNNSKYEQLDHE